MARGFTAASSQWLRNTSYTKITNYPWTIACWAQTSSTSTEQGLVGLTASATNGDQIELFVNSSGQANGYVANSAGTFFGPASGTAVSANTWFHAAYVGVGATNRTIYVNGAGFADTTSCVFGGSTNHLIVGAEEFSGTPSKPLSGRVAEVCIWNVALTQAEITALSKGARAYTIRPASLVGYWPLDGLASPEPDLSGFAHNLTLTAAPPLAFGPPMAMFTPRWPQFLPPPAAFPFFPIVQHAPTGPDFPITLRTWIAFYNPNLIGKDKLPNRQQDWPVPTPPIHHVQFRTWASWYNLNLIGKDVLPFRQQDWPVPTPPIHHVQFRTWAWWYNLNLIGKDQLPFRQQDWPLPTQPAYFAQWRSWTWNYNRNLIGQDQLPFRQQDWPLPTASPYSAQLRTWTWTILPIMAPSGAPFGPFDWPLPGQPAFPIGLRSWIASYNPNLIGQDALPVRQQDWPLPIPNRDQGLRSWTWNYNPNLVGQDQLPFRQQDWPLAIRLPPRAVDIQPNLLLTTLAPSVIFPFTQYDWPVPAGYPYPASLRAGFAPNLVINLTPAPIVVSEWLIRARRRGRR